MVGRIEGVGKVTEAKGDELYGFELAGRDGVWRQAEAVIAGKSVGRAVVVTSDQVKQPVAVRYACHPQAPKGRTCNPNRMREEVGARRGDARFENPWSCVTLYLGVGCS